MGAGRVIVIAQEPILDGAMTTNRQLALALYGLPGKRYALQRQSGLGGTNAWVLVEVITPTTLKTSPSPQPATASAEFFRLYQLPESNLSLRQAIGQTVVEWPADCAGCVLQETAQPGNGAIWSNSAVVPQLIGDHYEVNLPAGTNPRYYRLAIPLP